MSKTPATTTSFSNFNALFEEALRAYNKKTKQDLTAHPLATQLQAYDSPAAILTMLKDQVDQFKQSRSSDERLHKWLNPTINVLYAFSQTLGEGIGLVFSPAKAIFAGAGVLLLAAKEVEASQDILIDIFERIENFFRRLEVYTKVPPTPAMTDTMVKIMVEVLDTLGTATMEMKQSRAKKFLKKIAGITKLEDGLKKLDKMTNEEARMANAEAMRITHDIDKKLEGVDEKVRGVGAQVKGVHDNVQRIDKNVQEVSQKVQDVETQVQDVNTKVREFKGTVQEIKDDRNKAAMEEKVIMQQTAYDVDDVKRRQLRECLRNWQSPSDPSTNHNFASDRRHQGTAVWFCKGSVFEEWKAAGSLLWIHGKPGCGKSILCSAIINDITTLHKAGLASMAYFYFDFRDLDKQSRRDLLHSLLIQLSARSDPFCDILSQLYKEHDDGTRQPSDGALMHCLKEMLTLPDQGPVYLILDALDECPNASGIPSSREQVLDLVKELVGLRVPSLHICVTSRPEVDIRYAIEHLAFFSVSLHNESGQKKDITDYIKSVVHSPSATFMKRWRDGDKDLVIKTLSERADGMFRWVFCQLETLRHCLPQNVPRVLSQLPASLDETYGRILKEIGKTNQSYARRLLQCLTVAIRPLRVEELAEILALDFDGANKGIPELKEDWRWKDQQEAVLSTCSGLISVVGDRFRRVVQFSHFSVKEFLTSDRLATSSADISYFHILPEPAHTVTVKACLGILLQLDIGVRDGKAKRSSSLAWYAARYWVNHAQFENVSTHVEDGMRRLFDPKKPHFENWLELYDVDKKWDGFAGDHAHEYLGSPLYYASSCGFRDLVAHLLVENAQHVNAPVGRNHSPLVAALRNRHFHVAELLYRNGADVGITGDKNQTLLHAVSVGGFVDIAQWLLDHGVDANSQQDNDEASLHLAEANRRAGRSISVDAMDDASNTPLHLASQGGHFEIVRQLLLRGADVTAKDQFNWTPLHLASSKGCTETVQLLIEHGADVTAQDQSYKTPLHLVSSWDDSYLLLSHGATKSNAKAEIVRLLIQHGGDVTAQDETHSTPLHLASSKGNAETVRLLIQHGAVVTAKDRSHNTPLHLATSWDEGFLMLPHGAKSNAKAETAQVLIEHGADVNARDGSHSTPLHLALSSWSAETVQVLIEHGADVNTRDGSHQTPLHLALSSWSPPETVQILIEHGADVNAQDGGHSTPLHLASSLGIAETVRLLIKHGANVNALDVGGSTPLHLASSSWSPETVRLLVEHGADVNARDGSHQRPLDLASSLRSAEIVRLLIEHGASVC